MTTIFIKPVFVFLAILILFPPSAGSAKEMKPAETTQAASDSSWLKGIPLDKAIRIGNGSVEVIEFSDPDCRFSRRMVRYWDMRKDVTRYIFLIALKNHPEAEKKALFILCAANREDAYRKVYAGQFDFGEKELDRPCDDHGLFALHRQLAAHMGVIGTPTYFIKGKKIDGAKVNEIETLVGGQKVPFDASDPE